MSPLRLLLSFVLATAALSAHAFERPFPSNAKRGVMEMGHYPNITVNDTARRLSAGARIWNRKNRIQVPASLTGQEFVANYTENAQHDIDRVWILTDEEIKRPLPKPAAATTTAPAND